MGLKKGNIFKKLAVERKHYDFSVERMDSVIKTKKYAKVKHFNKRNLPFIAGLFIIVILLSIVAVFYAAFSEVKESSFENITRSKIVTVNQTLPSKISFSQYLQNISYYDKKEIVLQGFLRRHVRGDLTTGVYVESILDDEGNEIDLIDFNYKSVPYFPVNGTTNEIYSVSGIFKRQYKTLQLKVKEIGPVERNSSDKIEVNKTEFYIETITKTTAVPRHPKIKSLVFAFMGREIKCDDNTTLETCSKNKPYYCTMKGLLEKSSRCGCPDDYNIKDETCERIKKCSDFTIYGECSFDKPKQCIDGVLVDKAQICGCPEDYKPLGNSCVKIKRCSDGTIYGECSKDKPYFCSSGELIKNPESCGCNFGYSVWKGECIEKEKARALSTFDYLNDLPLLEKRIQDLINIERERYGLSALEWNDKLAEAAEYHSEDMALRNFFSHESPEGHDFSWRYDHVGFNCAIEQGDYIYQGAENLHQNWLANSIYDDGTAASYNTMEDLAKAAVQGWMNSPGHRKNILTSFWRREGIGVAVSDDRKIYATQDFC